MKVLRDFIDFHCEAMGLSREEYAAYYLSEGKGAKTFEQFSINEEEKKSRSEGFVPATIKRDFENFNIKIIIGKKNKRRKRNKRKN